MDFTCCCPLSWLPIWLWSEVVDPCFIHCHIFMQKILFVANNALNHQCIVVFDRLWANAAHTFNTAFSLTNVHAKWWIQYLLISSTLLLSLATSIFLLAKTKFLGFFGVFRDNCWIWLTWAFSTICVCTTAFKVSIPPLNHCFWWSRVQITFIKSNCFAWTVFFPPLERNALSTHEIQIFPLFENLQQ